MAFVTSELTEFLFIPVMRREVCRFHVDISFISIRSRYTTGKL